MARTKVFDPAAALDAAMSVFWQKGYEATSLDDLLRAMGIGRQSMYDTFGDKKQLYLSALEHYIVTGEAEMKRQLTGRPSPLAAIADFLRAAASVGDAQRARGCLAVNAVAEFGSADSAVVALNKRSERTAESLLDDALAQAQGLGEVDPRLDTKAAAHFVHTVIRGMRISAKNGATVEQLQATVGFTMAALRIPPA